MKTFEMAANEQPLKLTDRDIEYLKGLDRAFVPGVPPDVYVTALRSIDSLEAENVKLRRAVKRTRRAFLRASVIAGVMTAAALAGWFLFAWTRYHQQLPLTPTPRVVASHAAAEGAGVAAPYF